MNIKRSRVQELNLDIDNESVGIGYDEETKGEPHYVPLCYWHLDEVVEDENVAITMCKAIQLYYEDREKLLLTLGHKIID